MKRKLISLLLVITMVFLLFSCDSGITDIMKRMGNNIAGVDAEAVSAAVDSVTVKEDATSKEDVNTAKIVVSNVDTKVDANKFSYKEGDNVVELFTIGKVSDSTGKNIIGIDGKYVELESTVDLSKVTSVLPPQSLDKITSSLDGNAKSDLIKKFSEKITDENTKKAAEGTKIVVQAILETAQSHFESKLDNKTKEILNGTINNMNTEKADEMTVGDLVFLETVTNVIADSSSAVIDFLNGNDAKLDSLIEKAYDSMMSTVSILNNIDGTSNILEGVDLKAIINSIIK